MVPIRIALVANSERGTPSISFPLTLPASKVQNRRNRVGKSNTDDFYDIIIIDKEFADSDFIETIKTLTRSFPHSKLIVLAPHTDGNLALTLIKLGVVGIMSSAELNNGFAQITRTVYNGKMVIASAIVKQIVAQQRTG